MNNSSEHVFDNFIKEVKEIEKKDSVYTSKQQIERLLRPGSSYANLNPFDVLMVDFNDGLDKIRKQYKRLSILLHSDKNLDDKERAETAFEFVNRAYKTLENEETRNQALEIVEEAKFILKKNMDEKRKKLKKEKKEKILITEDDPEKYNQALRVITMKLFADYERKRRSNLERLAEERKRKREDELAEEEKKKNDAEWKKNFEESRESRINSWKNFQTTKKTKRKEFRPPKNKTETR